jgi:hypothetical protein
MQTINTGGGAEGMEGKEFKRNSRDSKSDREWLTGRHLQTKMGNRNQEQKVRRATGNYLSANRDNFNLYSSGQ